MPEAEVFRVLPAHIVLLRNASVEWAAERAECGAPAIDSRRPYGDSNVHQSMVDVLRKAGLLESLLVDAKTDLREVLRGLHRDTELALRVFLATGTMTPGLYSAPIYTDCWKRVGD